MIETLVSVVMITYGHEKYIEESINGVLSQQLDIEIELIISDDCSPDNTEHIVNKIIEIHPNGHWIKYIRHNKNKGAIPNFAWTISQAKGKYIAICEGDDYWIDPLKLQKQVDFLEKNKDYSIHSSHAQTLKNDEIQDIIGNSHHKKTYEIKDFFAKNNLIACTTMFRNHKINTTSFKDVYFGDWMLYVNVLNYFPDSKAFISEECYSVYRINESGAMSQLVGIKSDQKHFLQIEKINHFFKTNYSDNDISIINGYAFNIYKYFLIHNEPSNAINIFWRLFKLINFKVPFKKYLSYFRYRKQLT